MKAEIGQPRDLGLQTASFRSARSMDQAEELLLALRRRNPVVLSPSIFSDVRGSFSFLRTVPARNPAHRVLLPTGRL